MTVTGQTDHGHDERVTDTGGATEPSTRTRLLDATVAIIEEKGIDGLRVAEVARRAGLTTGAIYANYATRSELVAAAIVSQQRELFRAAVEAGPVGEGDDGPSGWTASLLHALTQESATQDRLLVELFASATRDAGVREVVVDQLGRREDVLRDFVEAAQAAGRIRADIPAGALAYVILLLGTGTVVTHALNRAGPDPDDLRALLDALFTALG